MLPKTEADLEESKNYNILTTKNLVAIDQGGTDARTRETAISNLLSIPNGLVANTAADVPTTWSSQGYGFLYVNDNISVDTWDRPSTWMWIFNIGGPGYGLRNQLGFRAGGSDMYIRGGSTSGDNTFDPWYKILTTKSTITTAQGGTGVKAHTANRLVYSTSATTI